ncbi:Uncharacterised protein [uncultured archaeon]|nr:Uncharacterised protein [uncultured archaeon]
MPLYTIYKDANQNWRLIGILCLLHSWLQFPIQPRTSHYLAFQYLFGKADIRYKDRRVSKALTVNEDNAATVRRVFELREPCPDALLQKIVRTLTQKATLQKRASHSVHAGEKNIGPKAFYEGIYRYSGVEAEGQNFTII